MRNKLLSLALALVLSVLNSLGIKRELAAAI